MLHSAGIVLAGGRSRRMGTSKAALEWHGSTMLRRVVGLVERAVEGPVVVVRAPGHELPALPARVPVVADEHEGRGPLEGLAAGLAALGERVEVVYVSAVDLPLLHPAFVRAVLGALGQAQAAMPRLNGTLQPLAAAYRTSIHEPLARLLAGGKLRAAGLIDAIEVRELDRAALLADPGLARCDPRLDSLRNVNDPADYREVRARPAPEVSVLSPRGRRRLRAATLGQAAAALTAPRPDGGGALPQGASALLLNGQAVEPDPELPLAEGDMICLDTAGARR